MENASKALLIAGAILLVIAIIAIGMSILGSGTTVVEDTDAQIRGMSISSHNAQFDGITVGTELTGREVKDLVTKLLNYNKNASKDLKVDFNGTASASISWASKATGSGWDKVKIGSIVNNEVYEVKAVEYNDVGAIDAIQIDLATNAPSGVSLWN